MKGLLFTYLLTYGGAAAALFNPFVGMLIYLGFAILKPDMLWPWSVPPGNYSKVVAIAMLVGWAFRGFGRWQLGRAWAVMVMLACFLLWTAVAANFAVADRAAAWMTVDGLLKIVLPIFVGITTIVSVRQLKTLAWVMVLCEGYLALEFNLSYLGGYNRVREEGFGSLDNNGAAVALVACLGLTLFLGIYERRRWIQAVALGAGLLMAHAILLTFSRGGMLSMGITGFLVFLLIPKRPVHYAFFVAAALVVVWLAGPEVVDRFKMTFITERGVEASADSRFTQWSAALRSLQKTPLGVGPDQWRLLSHLNGVPEGQAVHSTWMQVAAELGVPGLTTLLLYYLLCIKRLLPMARGRAAVSDPDFRPLAGMVIASLSGFLVAAQFVTLHRLEIPYFVALIGAVLLKLSSMTPPADIPADEHDPYVDPTASPDSYLHPYPYSFPYPAADDGASGVDPLCSPLLADGGRS